MNEVIEAQPVLKEYAAVQEKLCSALFAKFEKAEDRYLTNIPSLGLLEVDSEVWKFSKHGLGVRFERPSDLLTVDVHRHIATCPTCIDSWRLIQYLESKHIYRLNVGAKVFDAQDEKSLDGMLNELLLIGVVTRGEGSGTFVFKTMS